MWLAAEREAPAIALGDESHEEQAQTHALPGVFRGEERLNSPAKRLFVHSRPAIGEDEIDQSVVVARGDGKRDAVPLSAGVKRVVRHHLQGLNDSAHGGGYLGHPGKLHVDSIAAVGTEGSTQIVDDFVGPASSRLVGGAAGDVAAQVFEDFAASLDLLAHQSGILRQFNRLMPSC